MSLEINNLTQNQFYPYQQQQGELLSPSNLNNLDYKYEWDFMTSDSQYQNQNKVPVFELEENQNNDQNNLTSSQIFAEYEDIFPQNVSKQQEFNQIQEKENIKNLFSRTQQETSFCILKCDFKEKKEKQKHDQKLKSLQELSRSESTHTESLSHIFPENNSCSTEDTYSFQNQLNVTDNKGNFFKKKQVPTYTEFCEIIINYLKRGQIIKNHGELHQIFKEKLKEGIKIEKNSDDFLKIQNFLNSKDTLLLSEIKEQLTKTLQNKRNSSEQTDYLLSIFREIVQSNIDLLYVNLKKEQKNLIAFLNQFPNSQELSNLKNQIQQQQRDKKQKMFKFSQIFQVLESQIIQNCFMAKIEKILYLFKMMSRSNISLSVDKKQFNSKLEEYKNSEKFTKLHYSDSIRSKIFEKLSKLLEIKLKTDVLSYGDREKQVIPSTRFDMQVKFYLLNPDKSLNFFDQNSKKQDILFDNSSESENQKENDDFFNYESLIPQKKQKKEPEAFEFSLSQFESYSQNPQMGKLHCLSNLCTNEELL